MGLLRGVDGGGGCYGILRVGRGVKFGFGESLKVIKAAGMLELVVTPGADVVLTASGKELLRGKINARKRLLREQIKKLPLFRTVVEALQRSEDHRAEEGAFLEIFALHLPAEDSEAVLKTVIDWGRYAELLGYNPETHELYLDQAD